MFYFYLSKPLISKKNQNFPLFILFSVPSILIFVLIKKYNEVKKINNFYKVVIDERADLMEKEEKYTLDTNMKEDNKWLKIEKTPKNVKDIENWYKKIMKRLKNAKASRKDFLNKQVD